MISVIVNNPIGVKSASPSRLSLSSDKIVSDKMDKVNARALAFKVVLLPDSLSVRRNNIFDGYISEE